MSKNTIDYITQKKLPLWDDILFTFAVATLYFLAGKLSFYLSMTSSIVTISIFFAEGIALAAVIFYGKRVIPGIFMGQFFLALSRALPFDLSLLIGIVNALEAYLAYYMLLKNGFHFKVKKIKSLYFLFFMIVMVLQPFSAFFGTLFLWYYGYTDESYFSVFFAWWFGNSMGQMLITPMILFLYSLRRETSWLMLLFVFTAFMLLNYVFIQVLSIDNTALLFSLMIPVMLLVSNYLGLQYASVGLLGVTLSSLLMYRMNLGVFTHDTLLDNLININFYILAQLLIVYIHGVLILEKEGIAKRLFYLNRSLEKRVEKEVDKNRQKERLLMQKSRYTQMGEMIAIIAHQWKQPLNTLSLLEQRLHYKCLNHQINHEILHEFHLKSQENIQYMSQIIEDFRLFFKPQKEMELFLLNDVFHQVKKLVTPFLAEEKIALEVEISEDISLYGYSNEFGQVLMNIITNAKDAYCSSPDMKQKRISIRAYRKDKRVYIQLKDHAGGIEVSILSKIFDPYFTTKEEYHGTGLGLYIAKIVIEQHMHGNISVNNMKEGAVFIISLPESR